MMLISIKKWISLFLLITILMSTEMPSILAQSSTKKSVLVLNSYHKGYKWSDNIIEGITSVFGPNARNINMQIEDMDTHRISDNDYTNQLYEIYKYKFREKKFDVIIACDDAAFAFLLKYHNELFAETPIVFCGVNYFDDSMLAGQNLFTGIVEGQDIKSTLDIALKLHPATKNVYVINDNTITGNAIEKTLQATIPQFTDRVNFISLNDYNIDQLKDKVAHLPPDSLILFLILFQDTSGRKFSYSESISLIATNANAPIYGVWDFTFGYGLVGGMLTSGYYQGELAANLAQRVLKGESPLSIPIIKNSPNHYMFDSLQMKRFNIHNSDLPSESIIINDTYSGKKQVLVLNSYHHGMTWTDSIISGIKSILDSNSNIELYYEFMDTKHNTGPEYIQKMYDTYKYKFSNKHFDAIITSDDDAYNFLLKYQWEIFPNTPIVFCGVNYFQNSDLKDNPLFTGVVELVDVQKTIEVALTLQPNVKKIIIINDNSVTGEANKKILHEVIPKFPSIGFTFFEDMNMSEIQNRVAKLPNDTIILLMSFNKDKSNNNYSYDETIRIIADKATVPIYGIWDFYLGHGIVGGMLTNGYYQGEAAAGILSRILGGEKPQDIPVVKQSPNKYMFDYNYLTKYNIDQQLLPYGSIVTNKPVSNYNNYFFFALAVVMGILFIIFINQRKKAQDQLKIFATTDSLTGMLNRGTGLAILQQQLRYNHRYNSKSTIIFVDVNHLKAVNDTYGHQEGDNLIQTIGRLLPKNLRKSDVVCRFGGDEFLIILPICNLLEAMDIWVKIRTCIESYNAEQNHKYTLSVSHGFAEYDPANPVSVNTLITRADTEMYANKRLYKLSLENNLN
ncbi:MAG: diguanylate cyclase [Sporomusaceae bacterium]|nr:diguanylate cyclase [Sporomusaceae bacterium]